MATSGDSATKRALLAVGAVFIAAAALSAFVTTANLVRVRGPAVGDIVAFDANVAIPDELPQRLQVARTDGSACELDLSVMQRVHGSLIVDGAADTSMGAFQLHWAGAQTSQGGNDCGPAADIVASDRAMSTLLVAAGGVGIGQDKQALPLFLINHTPKSPR